MVDNFDIMKHHIYGWNICWFSTVRVFYMFQLMFSNWQTNNFKVLGMCFINENIYTARASIQKHGTANVWPWKLKWLEHESKGWGFKSPSGQDIFCLKNFDTFTRTPVRVSKMNAVAWAQLTLQMLTLFKKYIVVSICNIIFCGVSLHISTGGVSVM